MGRLQRALAGAVLIGVAAVLLLSTGRPSTSVPTYDDAISFLSATAKMDDWESTVSGDVVTQTAADWRLFAEHDGFPDPVEIYRGMASHDLHPPGYPLVLGYWTWGAGTSITASLLLNALLLGLTGAVVYVLGRRVGMGEARSFVAAAIAAWGPAALATGLETRSYAMAGLLTAATWFLALRESGDQRLRDVGLAVAGTALLLTHYSGIWALLGAGVLRLVAGRTRRPREALAALVPIVVAPVAALALFPAVLDQMSRQGDSQRVAFSDVDLVGRGREVVVAVASFVLQGRPAVLLVVAASVVGVALLLLLRRGNQAAQGLGAATLVTLLAIVGVYVVGLVPEFAMRSKYLVFVVPGVAIGLAGLLPGRRTAVDLGVGLGVLGVAVAASWTSLVGVLPAGPSPVPADAVVVDTTSRGIVLPVVWRLEPSVVVTVGAQADLPPVLEGQLAPTECVLYVSSLRREGSPEGRQALLDLLAAPEQLPGAFAGSGVAWQSGC